MQVKEIVPFGDPVLRKVAKPVTEINAKIIRLLDDMKATLMDSEYGAGLAAPQIGMLRRVIVMNIDDTYYELINPEIVETSGEQVGYEGCLSLPRYIGIVKRYNEVKITTMNRDGETVELKASGFLARCIQHEIDHLNGVLFIDHVQDNYLVHEDTDKKMSLIDALKLAGTK